jgi:CRP-like cAMP-binding protein
MSGDSDRSALDEAWGRWIAGDADEAIRRTTSILEKDASQLGAAALLFEALTGKGRTRLAKLALDRLSDAFTRRGDLPRSVAIALIAQRAELDPKPALKRVAGIFGQGSPRAADVTPAPPPLPPKSDSIRPELLAAQGDALLDAAEKVLESALAAADPRPADAKVPRLPLFGALPPAALEQLLSVWELREIESDAAIVREGTEGRDAFVVVRGRARAERKREGERAVLAVLGPGALFGEMALVSDAPRAASVVAEEPVQLLAVSRDALEKLASRSPILGQELGQFCRARMISNLMRHSPLLRAIDPREQGALIARFETRTFKQGEHLLKRGEETRGVFVIASGGVRVVGRDTDEEELLIASLGPGDVVGEISLVLRRPATADVIATHQTIALELTRDRFHEAIKEHPTLLRELYELATKREEEMRTVVAQEALDVEEVLL